MTAASPAAVEAARLLGERASTDHPLGPHTTYRVGGAAAVFFALNDEGDLERAAAVVAATGVEVLVVGKGSNLLVADAGFPGMALALGPAFAGVALHGSDATAGGAADLPVLARRTAAAGLRGMEWAVGVPGSVGGGVRMNAGGHGSDMAARLVRVRVLDLRTGNDGAVDAADLQLDYRRSALAPAHLVVAAELRLDPGDPDEARAEVAEIVRWRREHQPGGQNAGSIFTNPPGDSAGRLVEKAGCRGLRLGSAQVSDKHANFIQSRPGGSANDVAALIAEVRRRVRAETGIELDTEVRMIGFPDRGTGTGVGER